MTVKRGRIFPPIDGPLPIRNDEHVGLHHGIVGKRAEADEWTTQDWHGLRYTNSTFRLTDGPRYL